MPSESTHVSVSVDRPAEQVYRYAHDPTNLPRWAAGLAGSTIEQVDGIWFADSPMGRVAVAFVADNPYLVLDHDVTLPSGQVVTNPMRVLRDGAGCEVVFTVRRRAGMTDAEFAADTAIVRADLHTLREVLQGG